MYTYATPVSKSQGETRKTRVAYKSILSLLGVFIALVMIASAQQEQVEAQGGASIARFRTFGAVGTAVPLPTPGRTTDRPYPDVVIGAQTDLDGDGLIDTKVSLAPDVDGDGVADIVTWRRKTREADQSIWRGEWLITLSSARYNAYVNGTTMSNRSGFGNEYSTAFGRYAQPYLKIYEDAYYCYIPAADSDTGNVVPLVGDVDDDGKADLGCVNRFQRAIYFLRSSKNYDKTQMVGYTIPTSVPLWEGVVFYMADVDGDLKDDFVAVEEDSVNSYFYLVRTRASANYSIFAALHGGDPAKPRDKYTITQKGTPFFGDLDGDGKQDFGVYAPSGTSGVFKYRLSNAIGGSIASTNPGKFNDNTPGATGDDAEPTAFRNETTVTVSNFGPGAGETAYPVVADYDLDFVADLAVALTSSSNLTWRYRSSTNTGDQSAIAILTHSTTNVKYPVPGQWDADARADVMYIVHEDVGGIGGSSWNWYGGFSAGSRSDNYIFRDNNVFPSEKWGGAMGNWQDIPPTGTVYPPVPVGTPTPDWGIKCYRPEAPAITGTPVPGATPAAADTDLDAIPCTQGYQLTPTPTVTPLVSGFESHQIYKIDELAQTFEANYEEANTQRYYLNRRSFANAWANYLDPYARMHIVLYKVAYVYDSNDGNVTAEDRNPGSKAGAWHYTHDRPGSIQIGVDTKGDRECGFADRQASVYQPDANDLTSIIWQKAAFKTWLLEHRRGPLGSPRYWYVFNLLPEIERCTKLNGGIDVEDDALKAVRAFTRTLDETRDDIELYYELRVIPSLAMFGPQILTRNGDNNKNLEVSSRIPKGWWYGLLDETTAKEADEVTNNTRLGLYIRLLRRLTAADTPSWTSDDATLFQEFYRYNQQDNYTGAPAASALQYTNCDGNQKNCMVSYTPPPVATLEAVGAGHARAMLFSARDLFAMKVIGIPTLNWNHANQVWMESLRPSIIGQFGVGVEDIKDCVDKAAVGERYKCRVYQMYANARVLQSVMRQFESLQDDSMAIGASTYKYGDSVAGVSYWKPIAMAGYTQDDVRSQPFNYFDTSNMFGEPLLDWQLTTNPPGCVDCYSVAFTPTGRVFWRGAAGFFAGRQASTAYPVSSATEYNTDEKIGATLRYVDPTTRGEGAVWTRANDYSDWDHNLHAAITVNGGSITGACSVDAGWWGDVVYMLRDLSDGASGAVKASGTWTGGGGNTSSVPVTASHVYQMTCFEKADYANRSVAAYTAP